MSDMFVGSDIDWIQACDLYQDTQDRLTFEVLDQILEMTPEFLVEYLDQMYALPEGFSDFTPPPDISDLDVPF